MTRELAEALADELSAAGVRRVFGMPGGGPNLDMVGCAAERGIDFVLAHGETAACVMAAAYGRLTGTPGVAIVTRGPGLASALNGLAQATLDRSPLLLVSDTVTAAQAPRTAHQRLDQVAMAAPAAKWSGTLGHAEPHAVAAAALALTLSGPAGGVHLAFDPTVPGSPPPAVPAPAAAAADTLERLRHAGAGARRPVVVVGLDAARQVTEVRAALEGTGVPVLATYEGKGVVPESWPTYGGLFTGGVIERDLLDRADLVVGVGLDPVEPMPGPWPYDARVVLLHGHDVPTAYFGDAELVVGPYDETLPAVLDGVAPDWGRAEAEEARRSGLDALEAPVAGLAPQEVVRTVRAAHPDALLTVDSGAHMLVAMPLWPSEEPDTALISNGLATMGFALPAAIGVALARPGRRVVALTGDGGLGMALAELETVARLGLDLVVVVLNDAELTLIRLKQKDAQGGHDALAWGTTDFAAVATASGLPATVVKDVDGLADALAEGGPDARGPRLVDARIDPTGYPHVLRAIRG